MLINKYNIIIYCRSIIIKFITMQQIYKTFISNNCVLTYDIRMQLNTFFDNDNNTNNQNIHDLLYAYVYNNDIAFRKLMTLYANHTLTSHTRLLCIMEYIKNMRYEQHELMTNFIWSIDGFRQLIQYINTYDTSIKTQQYGIFCTVTNQTKNIHNIRNVSKSFYGKLYTDPTIIKHIIRYIGNFSRSCIAYTYENVAAYSDQLASIDFCLLMVQVMIDCLDVLCMDKIIIDNDILRNFWDCVNVICFTVPHMIDHINKNIELFTTRRDNEKVNNLRSYLATLIKILSSIDIERIDSFIYNNIDYVIDNNMSNVLTRLCLHYKQKSKAVMLNEGYIKSIIKIMKSKQPIKIKSEYVELIIKHNLVNNMNEEDILIIKKYVSHDIPKLRKQYIVENKSETIINLHLNLLLNIIRCDDIINDVYIIDSYLSMMATFANDYEYIINKCQENAIHNSKLYNGIVAMNNVAIKMLGMISNNHLPYITSYINDIVKYANTITVMDITDIINKEELGEMITKIIDNVINEESLIYLCDETLNILHRTFGIMLDKYNYMYMIDSKINEDMDDYNDVVTEDIAVNPFYIIKSIMNNDNNDRNNITDDDLLLVDRKTLIKICMDNTNPYTRQYIDINIMNRLNNIDHVRDKRNDITKKIKRSLVVLTRV